MLILGYRNQACEILFWSNMIKQIEDMVTNCESCMKYKKANVKQPLIPHEEPTSPSESTS